MMLATAEDRIKAELYAAALTVVRQKERAGWHWNQDDASETVAQ